MTSGWVIEPYCYKEKLLTQVTYLVQVGVVVGGVKHDVYIEQVDMGEVSATQDVNHQ